MSLMIVMQAWAGELPAPPPCFPQPEVLLDENVVDAALGDADGDTFEDIFALRPPLIEILRNDGQNYVPHATINVGKGPTPTRIETAHVSPDAFADIILLRGSDVVLFVSSDGTYPKKPTNTFALPAAPGEFVAADMNGDDVDDVAVTLPSLGQVMIVYHDAAGAVDHTEMINVGGEPNDVAAGDINGDTVIDLAVMHRGLTHVTVALNQQGAGFAIVNVELGAESFDILLEDLSNDGLADLAALTNGDGEHSAAVRVRTSLGETFGPVSTVTFDLWNYPGGGSQVPKQLISTLVNGQVAVWAIVNYSFYSGPIHQFLNDGHANFSIGPIIGGYNELNRVLVTDMDDDGLPDLILHTGATMQIVRDDGVSGVGAAYGGNVQGQRLERADINGDGIDDILVTAGGNVMIRWGGGPRHEFAFEVLSQGDHYIRPVAADFNADGLMDIFVSSQAIPAVLLQAADGSFSRVDQWLPPSTDAAVGDFNGDGALDIVTIRDPNWSQAMIVLTGDGTGMFSSASIPFAGETADVAMGDFNSDGLDDIAIVGEIFVNGHYAVFATMLSHGGGAFGPAVWVTGGETGSEVIVTDIDNDGKVDAAVSYHTLCLQPCPCAKRFINDGDGDFSQQERLLGLGTGIFGNGLDVRDLDGDGWKDTIAVTENGIWFFRGLGAGSIEPWQGYGYWGGGIRTPRIGDYDGDGRLDTAVILRSSLSFGTNYVYIYYGSCGTICRGDIDGNRNVNVFDLFELLGDWGPCANCDSDLDHDSIVGQEDLYNLLGSWGECEK